MKHWDHSRRLPYRFPRGTVLLPPVCTRTRAQGAARMAAAPGQAAPRAKCFAPTARRLATPRRFAPLVCGQEHAQRRRGDAPLRFYSTSLRSTPRRFAPTARRLSTPRRFAPLSPPPPPPPGLDSVYSYCPPSPPVDSFRKEPPPKFPIVRGGAASKCCRRGWRQGVVVIYSPDDTRTRDDWPGHEKLSTNANEYIFWSDRTSG